ncbi:MAG: ABC transporter substrate-binding protein, partial [candidate division WOR-3 bacterium]
MKNLKKLFLPLLIAVFLSAIICATIFVGCKPEPKTIKIGAILPLTGSAAYFGTHYQNGVNLAFEETKEDLIKQNVKVQFLFEDSQNSDKTAISALNKLLTVDNVNIVISLFPVSEALNPVTTKNPNILHIAATMSPGITEPENTMRIYFNQEQEGMKIVEFCLKKGMRKVFIIHNPIKAQEVEVKEWIIPPLKEKNIEVLTEVLPF